MRAKDIMTTTVATIGPDATIREIATLLLERRISAVPVLDDTGRMIGIVSEGDLIHRPETETEHHPSWWLRLMASPQEKALTYVKSHGGHARDVMTRDIVSVSEDASLEDIADTLEKRRIKRVPVLRDGRVVGIVSRADLLHGLVARQASPSVTASDEKIKAMVEAAIAKTSVRDWMLSVVVAGGVVHLWGAVESDAEKQAARVAAEGVPGVKGVRDGMNVLPPSVRSVMWAE